MSDQVCEHPCCNEPATYFHRTRGGAVCVAACERHGWKEGMWGVPFWLKHESDRRCKVHDDRSRGAGSCIGHQRPKHPNAIDLMLDMSPDDPAPQPHPMGIKDCSCDHPDCDQPATRFNAVLDGEVIVSACWRHWGGMMGPWVWVEEETERRIKAHAPHVWDAMVVAREAVVLLQERHGAPRRPPFRHFLVGWATPSPEDTLTSDVNVMFESKMDYSFSCYLKIDYREVIANGLTAETYADFLEKKLAQQVRALRRRAAHYQRLLQTGRGLSS